MRRGLALSRPQVADEQGGHERALCTGVLAAQRSDLQAIADMEVGHRDAAARRVDEHRLRDDGQRKRRALLQAQAHGRASILLVLHGQEGGSKRQTKPLPPSGSAGALCG